MFKISYKIREITKFGEKTDFKMQPKIDFYKYHNEIILKMIKMS